MSHSEIGRIHGQGSRHGQRPNCYSIKVAVKFGIKRGTQVFVYERDGEIAIKPITDDYIRNMAGISGTKGKLLKP